MVDVGGKKIYVRDVFWEEVLEILSETLIECFKYLLGSKLGHSNLNCCDETNIRLWAVVFVEVGAFSFGFVQEFRHDLATADLLGGNDLKCLLVRWNVRCMFRRWRGRQ